MNMVFERKLAIPMEVKQMYPLTQELSQVVARRSVEIKQIFSGESNKFLF